MSFLSQYIFDNLLWTHGLYIFLTGLFFLVVGWYVSIFLFVCSLLFLVFSLLFFRNPTRVCPELAYDSSLFVCPSDGRVVSIEQVHHESIGKAHKVSIFLSPLDVHVNWLPAGGTVQSVVYRPGKFVVAYAPKSSEINERNDVFIMTTRGDILVVRQIAGFIARRICCWIKKGDSVITGQKYGMIRFGSRMEIFIPLSATVSITVGQYVYGGQTVLGRWL